MKTTMKCVMTSFVFLIMVLASPETVEARPGQQGIVGAWIVNGQSDGGPAFVNTSTVQRDGTTSNADPTFGSGHGVWERIGPRKYAVRFVTIVSPFNPVFPNTIITVNGELHLDKSRDSASGSFVTTFTDLDGNPIIPPSTGTVEFTRITLD